MAWTSRANTMRPQGDRCKRSFSEAPTAPLARFGQGGRQRPRAVRRRCRGRYAGGGAERPRPSCLPSEATSHSPHPTLRLSCRLVEVRSVDAPVIGGDELKCTECDEPKRRDAEEKPSIRLL